MNKIVTIVFPVVSLTGLLATPLMDAGATISAQGIGLQWEATIEMNPEQARLARANTFGVTEALQTQGVTVSASDNQLELAGTQGIEQLRSALFDDAGRWADFLGGPVELTVTLPAGNAPVAFQLEARTTTGYRWDVVFTDVDMRDAGPGQSSVVPRYRGLGAPSIQTIRVQAASTGESVVRLRYQRPFEPDAPTHATLSMRVTDRSEVIEVSDPTPAAPVTADAPWVSTEPSPFARLKSKTLPASWDWRTSGIVPAVRDQGGCGSCWAFGTVGTMESAIKKSGGSLPDLSEQFLVSCNKDGWNCGDGGWTAHKYHYDTLAKNQTAVGAVLESAKPYSGTGGTCTVALSHPYKLASWLFITGSEWTMPTVDQIKNAIYTYGPVTAGVCADDGWDDYSGGVYNPRSNQCSGSTNHQIILVGWDDATSSWILRNSWGSAWGDSGYMNIAWDAAGRTSRVGEGTSWVRYQGTPPAPVPVVTSFRINGGASSTTSRTVTLNNTATGSPTHYMASENSTFSRQASWSSYSTSPSFELSAGQGLKTVWLKVKNATGESQPVQDSIQVTTATIPTTYSPSGNTYTSKPTYSWSRISSATYYRLQVYNIDTATYPVRVTVSSSSCNATTNRCAYKPTTALTYSENHKWRVAAGEGTLAAWRTFKPLRP